MNEEIREQAYRALHTREREALLCAVEQVLAHMGEAEARACFDAYRNTAAKKKEHGEQ